MEKTADIDIWRSAALMLRHHPEEAAFVAAQRADALLDDGDLEGFETWKRIVRVIELLDVRANDNDPKN